MCVDIQCGGDIGVSQAGGNGLCVQILINQDPNVEMTEAVSCHPPQTLTFCKHQYHRRARKSKQMVTCREIHILQKIILLSSAKKTTFAETPA